MGSVVGIIVVVGTDGLAVVGIGVLKKLLPEWRLEGQADLYIPRKK
jgi:hypothetical protein